ncbi:MAG: hypothetical protein ACOYXT_25885 [Bacteroidota bacterium]
MSSKFNALVTALVLISAAAFADSPVSLSVTSVSSNANVYYVQYMTAEVGKVKVSIVDQNNDVVFSEVLNNIGSFKRPYNFSQLAPGQYTIVLEDKNGKQIEKVNYTMNKINSYIRVSKLANAEKKFMLNITTDGTESVTVRILNRDNVLIHEQKVEVNGSFGLVYNLNQIKTLASSGIAFEVSTSSGKTERVIF